MSPRKLFYFYCFIYSRTSRTKLGDAWYVSNVSIISDVPCWYYAICYMFSIHFIAFLSFSGTNLLTRCHSASSLFSAVFWFQKSCSGNILGIGRHEDRSPYFSNKYPESEGESKRANGLGSPFLGAGPPLAAPRYGEATLATHRHRPFAYIFSPTGKP